MPDPIINDETGEPLKGPRGLPGGFTGGGIGGGGGGGGVARTGISALDSRQFGTGQTGYGQKKRYYTPGGDDQLAAVQTGEKVVPANISQSSTYGPEIDRMIQMGRSLMDSPGKSPQGYCRGGMVGYADGGEIQPPTDAGSLSPSVRILKLLLELDDCCGAGSKASGDGVPHYAMGGMVGGFNRLTNYMQPGVSRPGYNPTPAPAPQGGYQYNPEGGVTGGYNPNDPYGAYTNNHDTGFVGAGARQFGQYGAAGAYDPHGDPVLLGKLNELGQQDANDYAGRVYNQADMSGLDPAAAASLKLRALASAGQGSADALNRYRVGYAENQDQYGKDLSRSLMGINAGQIGQTNEARLSDWLAGNQANRQHKDQWGTLAGGVLGAGVGGYFGGRH